jgi:hypothetical protein
MWWGQVTAILSKLSRFQYVLAAATSIATKVNEETLTYLNQGQSYEIKLKKLGELSAYRGKILKVSGELMVTCCLHRGEINSSKWHICHIWMNGVTYQEVFLVTTMSTTTVWPTWSPSQQVPRTLDGQNMKLTIHCHLVAEVKNVYIHNTYTSLLHSMDP